MADANTTPPLTTMAKTLAVATAKHAVSGGEVVKGLRQIASIFPRTVWQARGREFGIGFLGGKKRLFFLREKIEKILWA